jgi:N-acetylglutamate synthase-like GNAT family acetyltransferase
MFDFALRIATQDDEALVNELLQASYPELMATSYDAAILADALPQFTKANPSLLSGGTYYLAESTEHGVIGCGGWTRERPGTGEIVPGLGHIRHFATHASWTGRGIGRSIYAKCEEEARSAGVTRFECYSSINGQGFYASLGFESVRKINVNLSSDVSVPGVLMALSI